MNNTMKIAIDVVKSNDFLIWRHIKDFFFFFFLIIKKGNLFPEVLGNG